MTPDRPFFLYLLYGATNAPHYLAPEWVEKYKGVFDKGWDAMRKKNPTGCPRRLLPSTW